MRLFQVICWGFVFFALNNDGSSENVFTQRRAASSVTRFPQLFHNESQCYCSSHTVYIHTHAQRGKMLFYLEEDVYFFVSNRLQNVLLWFHGPLCPLVYSHP
ncbi:hypothetical protein XENOCAPTIV_025633 [Xenoophorus captivus]|uniref:Secreted protein n=1 Tax=Xenoophorus captivus TaxID=1517983 RepID=A0ABV0RDI0_9TELE